MLGDKGVGGDDVAAALRHAVAVGAEDDALVEEALHRLVPLDDAHVARRLPEEARVEQVHDRVLGAARVEVDGEPLAHRLRGEGALGVVGVDVAHLVPARTHEGVERVRLAAGGGFAPGAVDVHPLLDLGQGRLARGLEVHVIGEDDGQVVLGHGNDAAGVAVNHGDGRAPVALARDEPVAQPVGDRALARPLRLGVGGDGADGLARRRAVEGAGVDHGAALGEGRLERRAHVDLGVVEDGNDLEAVFGGELEVALVVRGDGHDRARPVGHEHVVGDPDGDALAVEGVEGVGAGEHARLLALRREPLDLRHAGGGGDVGLDGLAPVVGRDALDEVVLGGEHHEGGPVDGVGARREDGQGLIDALDIDGEAQRGALGAADPVALHGGDALGPVHAAEIEQLLGVGGDAEEPLGEEAALDGIVAALAEAVEHLLVGEHGLAVGAPVGGGLGAVGEPALVQLQEPPLGPAVVLRVAGDDLAFPVEARAHGAELLAHALDVPVGPLLRVDAALDGGVLGGQAEGVEAHGEEHVVALHAAEAGERVGGRHGVPVARVEIARGVGKHREHVPGRALVVVAGVVDAVGLPAFAPLRLNGVRVVAIYHAAPRSGGGPGHVGSGQGKTGTGGGRPRRLCAARPSKGEPGAGPHRVHRVDDGSEARGERHLSSRLSGRFG